MKYVLYVLVIVGPLFSNAKVVDQFYISKPLEKDRTWGSSRLKKAKNITTGVELAQANYPREILKNAELKKIISQHKKKMPKEYRQLITYDLAKVIAVDLNANDKKDYLVGIYKWNRKAKYEYRIVIETCIMNDRFELKNCGTLPDMTVWGFSYIYFTHLDTDKQAEILMFNGWEDSSEYFLWSLRGRSWVAQKITRFWPAMFESKKKKFVSSAWPSWVENGLSLTVEKKFFATFVGCDAWTGFIDSDDPWSAYVVFDGPVPSKPSNPAIFIPLDSFKSGVKAYDLKGFELEIARRKADFFCRKSSDCRLEKISNCAYIATSKKVLPIVKRCAPVFKKKKKSMCYHSGEPKDGGLSNPEAICVKQKCTVKQ